MSRFDFTDTVQKIQDSLKKDKRKADRVGLGSHLRPISNDPGDYVVMPDWWKDNYGVMGLRFGNIVQIAGDSDSGKTSLALVAMRRAQQQGYGIVYVETEGKTTPNDLVLADIDPSGVILVQTAITEEAFDSGLRAWDQFFEDYPEEKLLFVFDSYGNTISLRDKNLDLMTQSQQPGGAAKTNRVGVGGMIARMEEHPVAILIVNYCYDNMGSHGKTNAGGKALNFFSMLTLQAMRSGWVEKQKAGQKVRAGAQVTWKVFKNHYAKALVDDEGHQVMLPKELKLKITAEGMHVA